MMKPTSSADHLSWSSPESLSGPCSPMHTAEPTAGQWVHHSNPHSQHIIHTEPLAAHINDCCLQCPSGRYAPVHSRSASINSYSNPPQQICHGQCYKGM